MAPEKKITIPWPFAPASVRHNLDTNLLKLIAMVLMVVDHMGAILFPQYRILRVIGRLSFPLFAYCMAVGCVYTRNMPRYISRVTTFALISQPLYMLAFGRIDPAAFDFSGNALAGAWQFYVASWSDPSIFFTLVLGMLVIWTLKEQRPMLTAALLLFCWTINADIDYKIWGVLLIVLFYLTSSLRVGGPLIMLAYMVWWGLKGTEFTLFGVSFGIQMFAALALILIYIPMRSGVRINKYLYYAFYPAHLALLYAARVYFLA